MNIYRQSSVKKTLIQNFNTANHFGLFEQTVCSRRQISFELYKNNAYKIGMNTAANKFYHINKLIGLDKLNFTFVHFKKLVKFQFLKNGKT